jgi:hypothetical protein
MTENEFIALMAKVSSIFEVKAKDKLGFEIWFEALKELDYNVASAALVKLSRTKQGGFIVPAEIIGAAVEVQKGKSIPTSDAIALIEKTVAKWGRYRQIEGMEWLKEQNVDAYNILKAVGYQNMCNVDPNFVRGTLSKMYEEVSKNSTEVLMLGRVFGKEIAQIQQKSLAMNGDDYNE